MQSSVAFSRTAHPPLECLMHHHHPHTQIAPADVAGYLAVVRLRNYPAIYKSSTSLTDIEMAVIL